MMENNFSGIQKFQSSSAGADYMFYFLLFLASLTFLGLFVYYHKQVKIPLRKAELFALFTLTFSIVFSFPYFYLNWITAGCIWFIWSLIIIPYLVELYYKKPVLVSQSKGVEDLSREREKIFQLLENGKINVQEAKELLNAIYEPIEKNTKQNMQESYHRDTVKEEKPILG